MLNLNTLITGNPATDNPIDVTTSLSQVACHRSAAAAPTSPEASRTRAVLGIWLDTVDGYGLLQLP